MNLNNTNSNETKGKLSWLSNAPWSITGYGNQTRLFVPRIKKMLGYDPAIIAFYGLEGQRITADEGIPIYPRAVHPYGSDIMDVHTRHFGAELCVSLMDIWVLDPRQFVSGTKWCPWFPVDMEPLAPPIRDRAEMAFRRIVYSKFGERVVNEAGLDCVYVPHGIETNVFKPLDRATARKHLGLPQDRFVVGMVAANKGNSPPRKAFPENLTAYAEFHQRHPEALLYLHTADGKHGEGASPFNLPEFLEHLDLRYGYLGREDPQKCDVVFCDQYQNLLGYPDPYMVDAYNAMDVHLLVSMGEGFGIPIVEAQACGTPVIVGDWTSMPELCFSGWKIPKSETHPYWTPLGAWQYFPRAGAIAEALEQSFRAWGNEDYRKRARKGALRYDADKVTTKFWKPVLAEIFESIESEPLVSRVISMPKLDEVEEVAA